MSKTLIYGATPLGFSRQGDGGEILHVVFILCKYAERVILGLKKNAVRIFDGMESPSRMHIGFSKQLFMSRWAALKP